MTSLPIEIPEHLSKQLGTTGGRLLEIERAKASFAPSELERYIYGQEYIDRRTRILAVVANEVRCSPTCHFPPSLLLPKGSTPLVEVELTLLNPQSAFDKSQIAYESRTDKFKRGLKKDKRLVQITRELGWSAEDVRVAEELIDMPAAFGLHNSMVCPILSRSSRRNGDADLSLPVQFLKTLRSQTTDEQKELFLKPAENYEMIGTFSLFFLVSPGLTLLLLPSFSNLPFISCRRLTASLTGCYAQTEIGHGSNVQGLETTATYNVETKSFTINTPSLTAAKYWIGGLGRSAGSFSSFFFSSFSLFPSASLSSRCLLRARSPFEC
jgi:acyl-CoA oxidase